MKYRGQYELYLIHGFLMHDHKEVTIKQYLQQCHALQPSSRTCIVIKVVKTGRKQALTSYLGNLRQL
jgi:hypothetical protein